ncbi:hypothetical protein pb186bvf_008481 [Paramecium bursaria]
MLQAYQTLVNSKDYPNLAITLTFIGFCLLSYFVIYQISNVKKNRSLVKEIIIAIFASLFLSTGTWFSFLALGLYF